MGSSLRRGFAESEPQEHRTLWLPENTGSFSTAYRDHLSKASLWGSNPDGTPSCAARSFSGPLIYKES